MFSRTRGGDDPATGGDAMTTARRDRDVRIRVHERGDVRDAVGCTRLSADGVDIVLGRRDIGTPDRNGKLSNPYCVNAARKELVVGIGGDTRTPSGDRVHPTSWFFSHLIGYAYSL